MRVKVVLTISSVAVLALIVAAVSSAGDRAAKQRLSSVKISARSVLGLGKILVDSRGRTLYMFVPDRHKTVTCHAVCAKIWPPIFRPAGAKIVAAGGVKQALLGSDKDSTGGRVVTYKGWPLYRYLGDRTPGTASGQALNLNGGLWYVMSTSGAIIRHKIGAGGGSTTTSPTTTSSGGGGGTNCSDDDGDGDGTAGGPDDGDGCI